MFLVWRLFLKKIAKIGLDKRKVVEYLPRRCFFTPFFMKKFLALSSLLFLAACQGQVAAPEATEEEAATDEQPAVEEPATDEAVEEAAAE
ncbi:hypothetical protein A2635_00450 [Candidatus Peribacteria bacterium RIFCSPHIGHO2_01_FULL_51_9]|nr:MAG: hypothetical protein A2635_00450 [Candidatus Peribacteria bacterium RIFCSPHIGHO2_01_FULL_51_9]